MDQADESFLKEALARRKEGNALRSLTLPGNLTDLCSNDYLGFARSQQLLNEVEKEFGLQKEKRNGSSGSRLLAGNTLYAEQLEKKIAAYHGFGSALLYNSGYDANVGLFSCIAGRGDTILYDELIHASVRDGARLSHAVSWSFSHNSVEELEQKIKLAKGKVFVAVESVYSMDGDFAPLEEMAALCRRSNAYLVVDEAHAMGVFGPAGGGRVAELGLQDRVFACLYTYGKAMGCDGAAFCGSSLLRDYLVNFSRSFIYTTARPLHALVTISCAYDLLLRSQAEREKLHSLVGFFKSRLAGARIPVKSTESSSPIQCLLIENNDQVKKAAAFLVSRGFDVRPILYPTVPKGMERIRLCLHSYNSEEEIDAFVRELSAAI